MSDLEILQRSFNSNPFDVLTWHALADCLEETGEIHRAELVRLLHANMHHANRHVRIQDLVGAKIASTIPVFENSIGMRFVPIVTQPIEFWMGSDLSVDAESKKEEQPRHRVELTRPYWMGMTPVTQSQYLRIMGYNPSYFCADGDRKDAMQGIDTSDFPVENVSWEDAQDFCRILNALAESQKLEIRYRLPSEAEWEYACRGPSDTYQPFSTGETLTLDLANFGRRLSYLESAETGLYLDGTCKVGLYKANGFGLYDMHGNVWEWCADWYDENYYKTSPKIDPLCETKGWGRVGRGGSCDGECQDCRSAYRMRVNPERGYTDVGFRVVFGKRT